jgi:hypothetical protein
MHINVFYFRNYYEHFPKQLDLEMKSLDLQPRTEVASKRLAISKLQKDHERVKTLVDSLSSECAQIKVSSDGSNSSSGKQKGFVDDFNQDTSRNQSGGMAQAQTLKGPQFVAIQEVDIDSLIIEEREREIKKLNNDIKLVNEMFK